MAKRKLPYMKFWVGDWLSSQKVMELSTIEEYCYFRLILWSWQAKGLGLESKDETLAEYCRLPLDVWMSCREKVVSLFEESLVASTIIRLRNKCRPRLKLAKREQQLDDRVEGVIRKLLLHKQ